MPPKKAVKEEKLLLGRPGNSLKSGIVSRSPLRASVVTFSR
jgi:obg-like ATPase 1